MQMVQNLAHKAQEGSGDGTTTACILAQAFCNAIHNHSKLDLTTHEFMGLLDDFTNQVVNQLDSMAKEIQDADIVEVATIAANNDRVLGKLISDALAKVGRDGIVTVEESKSLNKRILLSRIPVHVEQDPINGKFFNVIKL